MPPSQLLLRLTMCPNIPPDPPLPPEANNGETSKKHPRSSPKTMPLTFTPSPRSSKLWGTLAAHPFRLDVTIILVSFITLLFSLSAGVFIIAIHEASYRTGPAYILEPLNASEAAYTPPLSFPLFLSNPR